MKKWWSLTVTLLIPLTFLFLVGCGVAQEEVDTLVSDLAKAQQELDSVKAELALAQSEVSDLKANLGKAASELEKAASELGMQKELIRGAMSKSTRRPLQQRHLALSLGLLGGEEELPALIETLGKARWCAVPAACAQALGMLRSEKAIPPLVDLIGSQESSHAARTYAIAALGNLGDPAPLPWNAPIAENMNYRAMLPTLSGAAVGVLDLL